MREDDEVTKILMLHFPDFDTGPVMVLTVPSIRREYFGFKGIPELPLNYPSMFENKTQRVDSSVD